MIGVPGTAHRLFGALREEGISVILISQGSSEHSICFAIPRSRGRARRARRAPRRSTASCSEGQIQSVAGRSRLAASSPWSATAWRARPASPPKCSTRWARPASTCARSRRALRSATSPWSSTASTRRARCAPCTASFYLSPHTLSIGLIGPGTVGRRAARSARGAGRAPVARLQARPARARHHELASTCCCADPDVPLDALAATRSRAAAQPADLDAFAEHVHADHLPHAVIIDCIASADVAAALRRLARGRHPRRHAEQEGEQRPIWSSTRACTRRGAQGSAHYLYEATVGAGLPVIQTLRDLRETGDEIRRIEGILSGTLAYLFNVWDGRSRSPTIVRDGQGQGLHRARSARRPVGHRRRAQADHPRPRDGTAARAGRRAARKPGAARRCEQCTLDEFLERLPEFDAPMAERLRGRARPRPGAALRRLARRADRQGPVGLVELDRSHTFANINLTDNVVRFLTAALQPESAGRAGPGRRPRSDRRRRVRATCCACAPTWARNCEHACKTAHGVRARQRRQRRCRLRRPRPQLSGDRRSRAPRVASPTPGVRSSAPSPASLVDLPREPEKNTAGMARAAHGARR